MSFTDPFLSAGHYPIVGFLKLNPAALPARSLRSYLVLITSILFVGVSPAKSTALKFTEAAYLASFIIKLVF